MGIPSEDRPSSFVRDYDSIDVEGAQTPASGNGVNVDMPAMKDFASALQKNLYEDYRPHAQKAFADLSAPADGKGGFAELYSALAFHTKVKEAASNNVADQGTGALQFAKAAADISERYKKTDAYAAANVEDIRTFLGSTPPQTTPADPTTNPPEGSQRG